MIVTKKNTSTEECEVSILLSNKDNNKGLMFLKNAIDMTTVQKLTLISIKLKDKNGNDYYIPVDNFDTGGLQVDMELNAVYVQFVSLIYQNMLKFSFIDVKGQMIVFKYWGQFAIQGEMESNKYQLVNYYNKYGFIIEGGTIEN